MSQPIVYVVSDSAGETGMSVVHAGAVQFHSAELDIRRIPFVSTTGELDDVVRSAQDSGGIIAFTIVIPHLKDHLLDRAAAAGVQLVDLLGPIITGLESLLHQVPSRLPGMLHQLDEEYFRKVEAVEFAVKYDDGRDPASILKADLVLIGVSRTSKTPLSMYLAHKGIKVANVPLVPELRPPDQLFKVPCSRIVGLKIDPDKLNAIRQERLKQLGLSDNALYANNERIRQELDYAARLMDKLGCAVIDVSNRAVEETASIIMERYFRNGRAH